MTAIETDLTAAVPPAEEETAAGAPPLEPPNREVGKYVWRAFWTSRLLIFFAGILGTLEIRKAGGSWRFDPAHLTAPYHGHYGYFWNLILGPFARWDSVWYLTIAQHGYSGQLAKTAFFPLYPMLIHAGAWVVGSDLISGILISLACFVIALWFLYKLTYLHFGSEVAQVTVTLLAFAPFSFYFSAVYTESLFLALSVGAVYYARTGRWAIAGVLGLLAASSRNSGVFLIVLLGLMFLYGPRESGALLTQWGRDHVPHKWYERRNWLPRYRLTWSAAWLLLIPVGLFAYLGYLWGSTGSPFATFNVEQLWYHQLVGPFSGIKDGIVAAWDGLRQLMHGQGQDSCLSLSDHCVPVFFKQAGGDSLANAGVDLTLFGVFVVVVLGAIGVARRLPFAYLVYVLLAVLLPLSSPVSTEPYSSLDRYVMVVFPLFIWGGDYLVRKKLVGVGVGSMAALLGFFTMMFTTWRFIG
jgi:hypothetical protein